MSQDLTIYLNSGIKMSRGKAAAQAVHAALSYFNIDHGAVIVLGANKKKIESCKIVIRDAGKTEIAPGTVTAGIN